jgi:hypothetical protein
VRRVEHDSGEPELLEKVLAGHAVDEPHALGQRAESASEALAQPVALVLMSELRRQPLLSYHRALGTRRGAQVSELSEWDSFYVIIGSAAGALVGLQFVVMTLIAERPPVRSPEAASTFATPTVMHFSSVLLLSAVLRAPWKSIAPVAVLWGLLGLAGTAYSIIVARRVRLQTFYRPVLEDWSFHVLLPLAAYAMLALCALAAPLHARGGLFGVGAACLLLLFSGIHNAWDTVAYYVFVMRSEKGEKDKEG